MKKTILILIALIMCVLAIACKETPKDVLDDVPPAIMPRDDIPDTQSNNNDTDDKSSDDNGTGNDNDNATVAQTINNDILLEDFVEGIMNKVSGERFSQMFAQLIGADEGYAFWIGDNKFEFYEFSDEDRLEEAKTGKITFTIEGFGNFTLDAVVNGNFVLIFETENESVTKAFLEN